MKMRGGVNGVFIVVVGQVGGAVLLLRSVVIENI